MKPRRKRLNNNMKSISNKLSVICVLAAGIMWGCMGILVRTMNKGGFNSLEVTAFRSFVTAAVMLTGILLFDRRYLKIRLKDIWCFIGTGILSVVFFNVCYFSCMNYTTLSTAAILLYTAPSFVIIMSFFLFKESFTANKLAALLLAFMGCILVSGGFGEGTIGILGLLTGLGAGFGYALYSIFGRYALERGYSTYTITAYTFLFAAVGSLPFMKPGHVAVCLRTAASDIPFGVFMVFVTTVLAYLLYTKGLSGLENGRASIIASIEPVMASAVGAVIYNEGMEPEGVAGMAMILTSCVLVSKKVKK